MGQKFHLAVSKGNNFSNNSRDISSRRDDFFEVVLYHHMNNALQILKEKNIAAFGGIRTCKVLFAGIQEVVGSYPTGRRCILLLKLF